MNLNLERPLLFFDIESTGLNIATDSIIELSFVKILPMPSADAEGGNPVKKHTWRLRPWDYAGKCQRPINPGAMEVHGITDEELEGCPRFCDVANDLVKWLEDSDLSGFNSAKFDLPMLAEEFERARLFMGMDFKLNLHEKKMVDVQNIFHQLEPRNLKAAYMFYCGKNLENAHAAEADTLATYEILKSQLDRYTDTLKNDVEFLANFSERQKNVDYAGRLALNEKKEAIITFGKHKGKTAREVYFSEPSYFAWIENGDFTLDTKRQFERLRRKFEAEKREANADVPLNERQLEGATNRLANHFGSLNGGGKTGKLF